MIRGMHLFVQLFSCYCVPNPIVGNIDMLYLLDFLFYQTQCVDLNVHQNQMEA